MVVYIYIHTYIDDKYFTNDDTFPRKNHFIFQLVFWYLKNWKYKYINISLETYFAVAIVAQCEEGPIDPLISVSGNGPTPWQKKQEEEQQQQQQQPSRQKDSEASGRTTHTNQVSRKRARVITHHFQDWAFWISRFLDCTLWVAWRSCWTSGACMPKKKTWRAV